MSITRGCRVSFQGEEKLARSIRERNFMQFYPGFL
jgi:hypothetical protein